MHGPFVFVPRFLTRMADVPQLSQCRIIGKATAAASPFLVGTYQSRRTYLPIPQETVWTFRHIITERLPEVLWHA